MPPTKAAVYSECLPDWATLSPGVSAGDRLRQLCKGSGLNMLFFERSLKEKGKECLVYNKIDDVVHWNGLGLAQAADDLALQLHQDNHWFPPEVSSSIRPYEFSKEGSIFGDSSKYMLEFTDTGQFEVASGTIVKVSSEPWHSSDIVHNNLVANGTLLLAADSYFKNVSPSLPAASGAIAPLAAGVRTFISMHYQQLNFRCMELIQREYAPDIVVESVAERALGNMQSFTPPFYQKLAGLTAYAIGPENLSLDATKAGAVASLQNGELTLRATAKTIRLRPTFTAMPGQDGTLSIGMYVDAPKSMPAVLHWSQGNESYSEKIQINAPKGENYVNFFILTEKTEQPVQFFIELKEVRGICRILPCPGEKQVLHAKEDS